MQERKSHNALRKAQSCDTSQVSNLSTNITGTFASKPTKAAKPYTTLLNTDLETPHAASQRTALNATQSELLTHLAKQTERISQLSLSNFTTSVIAKDVSVSRNLASQYLNEFVRTKQLVKVDGRPVLFFHKRTLERYLTTTLSENTYESFDAMFSLMGDGAAPRFDQLIGNAHSLAPVIAQLKRAVSYPSQILPIMLIGELGTGKTALSRTLFQYAREHEIISEYACYITLNAAAYRHDAVGFKHELLGDTTQLGMVEKTHGGFLVIQNVEQLPLAAKKFLSAYLREYADDYTAQRCASEACVARMQDGQRGQSYQSNRQLRPHIIVHTTTTLDDIRLEALTPYLPLAIVVPPLSARSYEERLQLVYRFFSEAAVQLDRELRVAPQVVYALSRYAPTQNIAGLQQVITNLCWERIYGLDSLQALPREGRAQKHSQHSAQTEEQQQDQIQERQQEQQQDQAQEWQQEQQQEPQKEPKQQQKPLVIPAHALCCSEIPDASICKLGMRYTLIGSNVSQDNLITIGASAPEPLVVSTLQCFLAALLDLWHKQIEREKPSVRSSIRASDASCVQRSLSDTKNTEVSDHKPFVEQLSQELLRYKQSLQQSLEDEAYSSYNRHLVDMMTHGLSNANTIYHLQLDYLDACCIVHALQQAHTINPEFLKYQRLHKAEFEAISTFLTKRAESTGSATRFLENQVYLASGIDPDTATSLLVACLVVTA